MNIIDRISGDDTPSQPEWDPIDVDPETLLTQLGNWRRREVITMVDEYGEVGLGELSEAIAATENDKPCSELGSQERKRVYVSLYQCHAPKLDDAGIVEYDERAKLVQASGITDQVANIVRTTREVCNHPDGHDLETGPEKLVADGGGESDGE